MLIIGMQKDYLKTLTIGDYHDLYVKSDTLSLAALFETFRSCSLFISTWASMASFLEKAEVKLQLLTDIHMILMTEKGI